MLKLFTEDCIGPSYGHGVCVLITLPYKYAWSKGQLLLYVIIASHPSERESYSDAVSASECRGNQYTNSPIDAMSRQRLGYDHAELCL